MIVKHITLIGVDLFINKEKHIRFKQKNTLYEFNVHLKGPLTINSKLTTTKIKSRFFSIPNIYKESIPGTLITGQGRITIKLLLNQ